MIWIHSLDPVALDLGFWQIRWYGIFYAIAFLFGFFWIKKFIREFSKKQIEDFVFAIILGVIIGGRLGYFVFYDFDELFSFEIFKVWHGGMSFHGGLIGVIFVIYWLAKNFKKSFLEIADMIVIPIAIGLFFGRLGNFINAELIGRATNQNWGVVFPNFDLIPRFPSQLFEAIKNLLIAGILFFLFRQKLRAGILTFAFLFFYGFGRILVEIFWREPLDGFIFTFPKGAIYSFPVLVFGLFGLIFTILKHERRG